MLSPMRQTSRFRSGRPLTIGRGSVPLTRILVSGVGLTSASRSPVPSPSRPPSPGRPLSTSIRGDGTLTHRGLALLIDIDRQIVDFAYRIENEIRPAAMAKIQQERAADGSIVRHGVSGSMR